jgi:enhancing lycopene biosynthesis protein 2
MTRGKTIGVVLSGCGVFDGSEIHESVLTLLALDRAGAAALCMAPDMKQHHVVNHLTGKEAAGETRNVLVEAARIARGKIRDVAGVKADEVDGLILPGGFGAAKNLCDYAFQGTACEVNADVARLVRDVHAAGKPMGFICIAPVLAAKVFGTEHPQLTIGTDPAVAGDVEALGGRHVACGVAEFVVDRQRKIVSTPAYMLGKSIGEVAEGIERLVHNLLEMTDCSEQGNQAK